MSTLASESILKVQLAKLQAEVHSLESDISSLQMAVTRSDAILDAQKMRAVSEARSAFNTRQRADIQRIEQTCKDLISDADALLDTFPGLKSREYAGRYEVKAVEAKMQELYPEELISSYSSTVPVEFRDEAEAYSVYTYLERKVATLKHGTLAASLFSGVNNLLMCVCKDDGAAGKVAAGVLLLLGSLILFSPFLFLTVFTVVGLAALVQGFLVLRLFRYLGAIKAFLNETYDEDIFNADKSDILDAVTEFSQSVEAEYIARVQARGFVMNEGVLRDLEKQAAAAKAKSEDALNAKTNLLNARRLEAQQLLKQLDDLRAEREELSKVAKDKYIRTVAWERKWVNELLLDVTPDLRTVVCPWTQGNTLYLATDSTYLEQFYKLAVYQCMLRMPPDYAGQVVVDYKDMGTNLMRFSKIGPSLLNICIDAEAIDQKISRMQEDIQSRVQNILRSCDNIEEFNAMMKEYGSTGEAYVIVHICGLKSVDETIQMFLRNGPKVGYFFKVYATHAELKQLGKEFPLSSFKEIAEVECSVTPRTPSAVQRLLEAGA